MKVNSITNNQIPTSDNVVANKKYIDDSILEGKIIRFKETLENYLKVSV